MDQIKQIINSLADPRILLPAATLLFLACLRWPKRMVTGRVATWTWTLLFVAFMVFSCTDANFRAIILKPDNVPITMMLVVLGICLWVAFRRGVDNDERRARGDPLFEADDAGKVHTWPDLLFIEFIAATFFMALLTIWSIKLQAPLEQPANPSVTPNPSKAPWYFLGLQEMLVYYDPWIAGVVLPGLIIVGLACIPYLDRNPKGNGYYTLRERPFAIGMYLFGFLILWILLIVLGTFLRGPNWNFFGPYEMWDVHKVEPLTNVNLSEIIWVQWFQTALPQEWWKREFFGFVLVLGYFLVLPPVLARTLLKRFRAEMGFVRFHIMIILLLVMLALPIKMLCRWLFNLKYFISIPEAFFNI